MYLSWHLVENGNTSHARHFVASTSTLSLKYLIFLDNLSAISTTGETGSVDGGTVEAKEAWISQLAKADLKRFPCYKSTTWFEYLKAGHDYRIIVRVSGVPFCFNSAQIWSLDTHLTS